MKFSLNINKVIFLNVNENCINKQHIAKKVYKIHNKQKEMDVMVYSSDKIKPLTTKPEEAKELGIVKLSLPSDKNGVMVEFTFSNNVFAVYAYPEGKPERKKICKIDYMEF